MAEGYLQKRSLRLKIGENGAPVRTSVALEPEFWAALEDVCKREHQTIPVYIANVEALRAKAFPSQSLASAIRVQLLQEAIQRGRTR